LNIVSLETIQCSICISMDAYYYMTKKNHCLEYVDTVILVILEYVDTFILVILEYVDTFILVVLEYVDTFILVILE
jgi:hypothetical protein